MRVKKIYNIIVRIVTVGICIITINNTFNIKKIEINKLQAEKLLKETYKPLEDFNKSLITTENDKLLLVPNNIKCEEDFFNLFNKKIENSQLKEFYKDLIIEKNGKLYVNSLAYIPSIYTENGEVTKAYIKKTNKIFSHYRYENEELIIKETWTVTGDINKRSNYFVKDQSGEWILDHFNGTSYYGFVDINHNPWKFNREQYRENK